MTRITWILLILSLVFAVIALIPWVSEQLALYPGTVPPGWRVVDSKVLIFPERAETERIYIDGVPTPEYGFPVDRAAFPFDLWLNDVHLTILDTFQDDDGCALKFRYKGEEYTIYVYRPSGRTYPAQIEKDKRIYIIEADLPDRVGGFRTAGGEYFYGFRRCVIALAMKVE